MKRFSATIMASMTIPTMYINFLNALNIDLNILNVYKPKEGCKFVFEDA